MNATPVSSLVPLADARWRLGVVWFGGSGALFLLLLISSFGDVFQGQLQEVWSAALPTLLPTLSLILSVLGATAISQSRNPSQENDDAQRETFVRQDFYRLTLALSIAYLLLVLISFLSHPIVTALQAPQNVTSDEVLGGIYDGQLDGEVPQHDGPTPADVIKISNLWLAPVQSLVVAAMGVLFFTKRE